MSYRAHGEKKTPTKTILSVATGNSKNLMFRVHVFPNNHFLFSSRARSF